MAINFRPGQVFGISNGEVSTPEPENGDQAAATTTTQDGATATTTTYEDRDDNSRR
ncbi:hypothetical protein [Streptomyces rimosus]|uniref:hypothetical protein n=1 Tax=Streptomyces rimosus TaxID=1927 RepID=UPI000AABA0D9|nr:hypothetical protein [Streptomyces rimosus]